MPIVRCRRAAALWATAVLLLVACADDEDAASPTPAPTMATAPSATISQVELDKQKAQRAVLTVADVPGFTQDPPDTSDDADFEAAANACFENNEVLVRLGEDHDPRGVSSPHFSMGERLRVGSGVTFAETEDQARAAIASLTGPSFAGCFGNALAAQLRKQPGVSDVTATTTRLPDLTVGDQSIGYRTTMHFRTGGRAVTFDGDFTFIRAGRGIAVLSGLAESAASSEAERIRLATTIAGRMAGP
jgi:hypothetical protein